MKEMTKDELKAEIQRLFVVFDENEEFTQDHLLVAIEMTVNNA
tara:strand:+ start:583 stop:711 length:129 start_codon:yes stop_codon:yes gene_type:complete